MLYNDMDELIKDFLESNVFFTEEEIERVKNCEMVIEDMLVSGTYTIFADGKILVHEVPDA